MDLIFPDLFPRPGGRRCRVLFSYSPQNKDELQLEVNDVIDFLAEVEDGWWQGKLGDRIGVFPSNFVCEIPPASESGQSEGETSAPLSSPDSKNADAPLLPPKPVKETCRVLFAYDAANDDELTLKKDDIITIITKEVEDKGWWKGELRGKIGLFPDNFVEVIGPPEDSAVQKKPERPTKTFEKVDSKIPLISSVTIQKKIHDVVNHKEHDDKAPALGRNEGPFNKKNVQNVEKSKPDSSPASKSADKNLNLFQIKPDTVTSHRKSLELKANEGHSPPITGKKPLLPPPLSTKPKTTAAKSNQAKRLSGELNEALDNVNVKKLTADLQDLTDGGNNSKPREASGKLFPGHGNEELDLDSVERSDMLTHITVSRPKAPGRRPPSKEKENDIHSFLTNGNVDPCDKEKNQREWEKHKPPWVDELKSNLKCSKATSEVKPDRKSPLPGGSKCSKSPTERSNSSASNSTDVSSKCVTSATSSKQNSTAQDVGHKQSVASDPQWRVSELSIRFSGSDKSKCVSNTSPSKSVEHSKVVNSIGDDKIGDSVHIITKKEFLQLQCKVEYLEEIVVNLMNKLGEEIEKRKLLEKELNKLTNLVTQV